MLHISFTHIHIYIYIYIYIIFQMVDSIYTHIYLDVYIIYYADAYDSYVDPLGCPSGADSVTAAASRKLSFLETARRKQLAFFPSGRGGLSSKSARFLMIHHDLVNDSS